MAFSKNKIEYFIINCGIRVEIREKQGHYRKILIKKYMQSKTETTTYFDITHCVFCFHHLNIFKKIWKLAANEQELVAISWNAAISGD